MSIITIPNDILVTDLRYLCKHDQYDILGCLLLYRGLTIPEGTKLPSQLGTEISPFTIQIRRKIIDTELSVGLLRLEIFPRKDAIERANKLLAPHHMQIVVK